LKEEKTTKEGALSKRMKKYEEEKVQLEEVMN